MKVSITDNSETVMSELESKIQVAMETVGIAAERYAKLKCPVDTGNLRDSISHEADKEKVVIGTNVKYAPYVEFGAKGRKPKHYLKPAVEEHIDEYKNIIKSILAEK